MTECLHATHLNKRGHCVHQRGSRIEIFTNILLYKEFSEIELQIEAAIRGERKLNIDNFIIEL